MRIIFFIFMMLMNCRYCSLTNFITIIIPTWIVGKCHIKAGTAVKILKDLRCTVNCAFTYMSNWTFSAEKKVNWKQIKLWLLNDNKIVGTS